MKIAKLSLAAIVLGGLATSSFAADTIADAFKNGKLKGEIKTIYVTTNDNDSGVISDKDGFSVGGELNFITDDFYGFKIGVTGQTSHQMGLQDDDSTKVDSRAGLSVTNLSEAYLEYKFDDKTSVKLGRQYITSPLIFTSYLAWLQRDSFEAYNFKTTAIPDTLIWGGVLTKYFQRDASLTDNDTVDFHDPIYNLYVQNKSIKNLTLTAQALYMDGSNLPIGQGALASPYPIAEQKFLYTFGQAKYKLPVSTPASIRGSYYNVDYDTAQDTNKYILGGTVGFGNFTAHLDYGKVSDEGPIIGAIGDTPSIDSLLMQSSDSSWAGMETWVAKLDINMKKMGFPNVKTMRLAYGDHNSDVIGKKFQNSTIDVIYNHTGFLKGLMTRTRFANIHYDKNGNVDKDTNQQEFRFLAIYKF